MTTRKFLLKRMFLIRVYDTNIANNLPKRNGILFFNGFDIVMDDAVNFD